MVALALFEAQPAAPMLEPIMGLATGLTPRLMGLVAVVELVTGLVTGKVTGLVIGAVKGLVTGLVTMLVTGLVTGLWIGLAPGAWTDRQKGAGDPTTDGEVTLSGR